jgi:hypothetical protein
MKSKQLLLLSLLFLTASLIGCLGNTEVPKEPNLFTLSLTLPQVAQDYFLGADTITVIGYKMLIDSISVKKPGQEDEKFAPSLRLASYVIGFSDSYPVASGLVGGGGFNGVRYAVVLPSPQTTTLNDQDLVERDATTGLVTDTYSIALTGVYDRKFFRFRSKISRTVQYGFTQNVNLPDFNAYLEARLRGNWTQWFLNSTGTKILDPNNPGNATQIEENILKYFDIFTITAGELQ